MKLRFRRAMAWILYLCALFSLIGAVPVHAQEAEQTAENISGRNLITDFSGFGSLNYLFDGSKDWGIGMPDKSSLTLESAEGIGSVYLMFYYVYDSYTITDNATGTVYTRDEPYFHDFVDMEAIFGTVPTSITIDFNSGKVTLTEMEVFSPGKVPDYVQQWKAPAEDQTDLVLFSTHGDDEHLFFAGILPYYAVERGYQVQVVYLTDHHNNVGPTRMREMLNGLWAVGVDTYPVFGEHPDFLQKDIRSAYSQFSYFGYSREDLIGFVVEQLRRFKPKVAVGHDFNGEYGHGQHMVYADVLAAAVEISNDPAQYPELAKTYGVWDVPKTYIHLYEENEIVMDWDQPLESFGGKTAFEVSIYSGFQQHISQVSDFEWFYLGSDTAAEIPEHNPCYYGLYRSTVGEDVEKNDFFENVNSYSEQTQQEEAQRQAEEEARLKAEEEAKLKAEEEARLKAEEEARLKAEEEARQESIQQQEASQSQPVEVTTPQEPSAPADRDQLTVLVAICVVLLVTAVILVFILIRSRKRKRVKKYF